MTQLVPTKDQALILSSYPAPLAGAYSRALTEKDNAFACTVTGLLPAIINFWTVILVLEYARSGLQDPEIDQELARSFIKGRAVEGKRLALCLSIAKFLVTNKAHLTCPEIATSLFSSNKSHTKTYQILDEQIAARNLLHEVPPTADKLSELVQKMLLELTRLLTLNSWLQTCGLAYPSTSRAASCAPEAISLHGTDPLTSNIEAGARLVMRGTGEYPLQLYPLMVLNKDKAGKAEAVIFANFKGANNLVYRGIYDTPSINDPYLNLAVKQLFKPQLKDDRVEKLTRPDDYIPAKAREITLETLQEQISAQKYLKDTFVEPPLWRDIFTAYLSDERPGLLLAAPAGAGKSSLLCRLAEEMSTRGHIVLFWHAHNLPGSDLKACIESALGQGHELREVFGCIHNRFFAKSRGKDKHARLLIIVDALNEREDAAAAFSKAFDLAKEIGIAFGRTVKLILSIRDTALSKIENDPAFKARRHLFFSVTDRKVASTVDLPYLLLPPFTGKTQEELFRKYKDKFAFEGALDSLSDSAKGLLRKPLMLRLAAEAFAGRRLPRDLGIANIFARYLEQRLCAHQPEELQDAIKAALVACAQVMYEELTPEPETDALKAYLRPEGSQYQAGQLLRLLQDDGFIAKSRKFEELPTELFSFVFEGFGEYLLGSMVLPRELKRGELQDRISEIFTRMRRLPQLAGGLKLYTHFCIKYYKEENQAYLTALVNSRHEATIEILGELLGEYEADGMATEADTLYAVIDKMLVPMKRKALWVAMEISFQSGAPERLAALGQRFIQTAEVSGLQEYVADGEYWLGQLLYLRQDKYSDAEEYLSRAVSRYRHALESDPAHQKSFLESMYSLLQVLADSGKLLEASKLADELLSHHDTGRPEDQYGLALAYFCRYMIRGDAEGLFLDAQEDLEKAEELLTGSSNRRAIGRISISRANVLMNTAGLAESLTSIDKAIDYCTQAWDIQGKAYAWLCKAAMILQKAEFNSAKRNATAKRVEEALSRAEEIFDLTGEEYIRCLATANRAVLALLLGETTKAATLLTQAIAAAEESQDFYNRFDAEVLYAAHIAKDKKKLQLLLKEAEENEYLQGILHVCWQLNNLASPTEAASWAARAREIAGQLGWGENQRESIYMGFYAGIYLY
jgi:hypothetical protein